MKKLIIVVLALLVSGCSENIYEKKYGKCHDICNMCKYPTDSIESLQEAFCKACMECSANSGCTCHKERASEE
jgi:hypothetical protein